MSDEASRSSSTESGTNSPVGARAPTYAYKAFLSYSHASDAPLAAKLQREIEWFARPFYRGRAFRVFRDQTNLHANPDLWKDILQALAESEYYIYLASPDAAKSPWVGDEMTYWYSQRDKDKAFLVLAEGNLVWDRKTGDFDWKETNAIPESMKGIFASEPLWVDMRWAREVKTLDPKDPRFQDAVASLTAPLRGLEKDTLVGEHLRIQRKARKQRAWALTIMAVLTLAASVLGVISWVYWDLADQRARIATSRQFAALSVSERNTRLDRSLILAAEALRAANTFEARDSLFKALEQRPVLSSYLYTGNHHVTCVASRADGKVIAVAHGDPGVVELFDTYTRERLGEPLAVRRIVNSVAFSPDGNTLAVGYGVEDGGVVLFSALFGKPRTEVHLSVPESRVTGVAFNPKDKTLAATFGRFGSPSPGGIILFNVATATRITKHSYAVSELTCLAFSPDGETVAAGSALSGGEIWLWDASLESPRVLRVFDIPIYSHATSVAFSPDGKIIATGYEFAEPGRPVSGGILLYDTSTRKNLASEPLSVPDRGVTSVAFSPDGKIVAAGYRHRGQEGRRDDGAGGVAMFDVARAKWRMDNSIEVPDGGVTSVVFSSNIKRLVVGYGRGDTGYQSGYSGPTGGALIFDLISRNRCRSDPLVVSEGRVNAIAFSPDGKVIAAGYAGSFTKSPGTPGGVVIFDADSGTRRAVEPLTTPAGEVTSVAFSPDGSVIAVGCSGEPGNVALLDAYSGKRRAGAQLSVPEGRVTGLTYSPYGEALAVAYRDTVKKSGGVVLFVAQTGKRRTGKPLDPAADEVTSVAFGPDGRVIAVGYSGEPGVALFDSRTGKLLSRTMFALTKGEFVNVEAFSHDVELLAADYERVGSGRNVKLYGTTGLESRSTEALAVPEGGRVLKVAFSPGGNAIAAAFHTVENQFDAGVVVWDMADQKRLTEAPLAFDQCELSSLTFSPDGMSLAVGSSVYFDVPGDFPRHEGRVTILNVNIDSWQCLAGRIANRNFTLDEWRQYFPDEKTYRKTFDWLPEPPPDRPAIRRKAP